jgi:hypothetical protein
MPLTFGRQGVPGRFLATGTLRFEIENRNDNAAAACSSDYVQGELLLTNLSYDSLQTSIISHCSFLSKRLELSNCIPSPFSSELPLALLPISAAGARKSNFTTQTYLSLRSRPNQSTGHSDHVDKADQCCLGRPFKVLVATLVHVCSIASVRSLHELFAPPFLVSFAPCYRANRVSAIGNAGIGWVQGSCGFGAAVLYHLTIAGSMWSAKACC